MDICHALTLLAFFPIIQWLGLETLHKDQLQTTFVLLVGLALILYWREGPQIRRNDAHPIRRCAILLGLSYALILLGHFLSLSILFLPAFILFLISAQLYYLGLNRRRIILSFSAAIGVYALSVLFMNLLDWPMRLISGDSVSKLLLFLGYSPESGIFLVEKKAKLLLKVGNRLFEVAPECNGFGLLSASLVITVLLLAYYPMSLIERLKRFVISLAIALLFNYLRILCIILIAPHVPNHYLLMHETVGILVFYSGLFLIYWICSRKSIAQKPREPSA
jgi:exosortase/archaeosortase family protein